jgi:hypothetical protein
MATTTTSPPTSPPSAALPQPAPGAAPPVSPSDPPSGAVADEEQDRVLEIPPPPGRREKVVNDSTEALATTYAEEVQKAADTIEEFGITIEVTKLRDRLHRSVGTDLQRLLLATPGVPELLFNEAIAAQVEEEGVLGKPVKDESVVSIATRIESASTTIEQALSAINKSTEQFQESTKSIVQALDKVAKAIDDDDKYPTVAEADGDPASSAERTTGARRRTPPTKAGQKGEPGS